MSHTADRIALLNEMLELSFDAGPRLCYAYGDYVPTQSQAGYFGATSVVCDWLYRVNSDMGGMVCPRGGVSLQHDERPLVTFAGEDSIQ